MAHEDLTRLHLDVYDDGRGPWNPDHGSLDVPDDWEFLPSGEAYVTRTVKAAGVYWVSWRPRGRNRPHRRRLGLWAPRQTIEAARASAEQTSEDRARGRARGARQRARAEDRYRADLAEAIVDYLSFDADHRDLADEIAEGAARQAAEVGSGRVGRTRTLPLEERAALAARAWIRHRYTDYEEQLLVPTGEELLLDELQYRDIKSAAHDATDEFLAERRDDGG